MNRLPMLVVSTMLIVFTACSNEVDPEQGDDPVLLAEASADPWAGEAVAATGHLKIQMPVGVIGEDRYWIYLNGRIVSAPKRNAWIDNDSSPVASDFSTVKLDGVGWSLRTAEGRFLSMSHENWAGSLDHYLKSGDLNHVFKLIDLTLPPGKYRVEVAFLNARLSASISSHWGSFPFVISKPYNVEVHSEKVTEIYPGVPDSFETSPVRLAEYSLVKRALCSQSNPAPPDLSRLEDVFARRNDDPVVKALDQASATHSPSEKVVSLDLPAEMGGLRTFDGTQISLLAQATADRYGLPTPDDVATCIGYFPQFTSSYDTYLKPIAVIEDELESFRRLGRDLNADQ